MLEPVFDEGSRSGPCAERPVADVGECAVVERAQVERAHQKVLTTYHDATRFRRARSRRAGPTPAGSPRDVLPQARGTLEVGDRYDSRVDS